MFFSFISTILNPSISIFFFFNDPATTEIYTLSLHDALPISFGVSHLAPIGSAPQLVVGHRRITGEVVSREGIEPLLDRKSTRLNSSHPSISYAVFCLKKKNKLL